MSSPGRQAATDGGARTRQALTAFAVRGQADAQATAAASAPAPTGCGGGCACNC
jgi:hypothetical protein